MSQEDSIKNILSHNKRDLYYNENCNIVDLLNEVKAFGCIPKYQTLKKLFTYLNASRYDVLTENFEGIKIMLELIDEKYSPTDADCKKIFDCIKYNYSDKHKMKVDDIYLYLCNKFGISNENHFQELLKINDKKPINKFTTHIINYFNKNNTSKDYKDCNFYTISTNIFLELIDNPNLRNILSNELIDKIFDKFDFTYVKTYNYNMIYDFIQTKLEVNHEIYEKPKLKKKDKKNEEDSNKETINTINTKYTDEYINRERKK